MLEKRWSFEGGSPVLREMPRTRSSIDLIEPGDVYHPDDTVRLDGGGYGGYAAAVDHTTSPRQPGLETRVDTEFDVRDAFAASALASLQSMDGSDSVLDLNSAELTRQVALLPEPAVAEDSWTPPTLTTPPPPPPDPGISDFEAGAPLPEIGRRQRSEPRRNLLPIMLGAGVLGAFILLVGGLYVTFTERDEPPVAADASAVAPAPADAEAGAEAASADTLAAEPATADPAGGELLANVEGVLQLNEATLRQGNASEPGEPATRFAPGQKVSLWLAFDYTTREAEDSLGVIWFKEDQELTRSSFGLTSEVQATAMAAPVLEEPGTYRADISLNDQVIHSVAFEVAG